MIQQNCEIVSVDKIERHCRKMQKSNMKKYHKSWSWVTILTQIRDKFVIECQIDNNTVIINKDWKYFKM